MAKIKLTELLREDQTSTIKVPPRFKGVPQVYRGEYELAIKNGLSPADAARVAAHLAEKTRLAKKQQIDAGISQGISQKKATSIAQASDDTFVPDSIDPLTPEEDKAYSKASKLMRADYIDRFGSIPSKEDQEKSRKRIQPDINDPRTVDGPTTARQMAMMRNPANRSAIELGQKESERYKQKQAAEIKAIMAQREAELQAKRDARAMQKASNAAFNTTIGGMGKQIATPDINTLADREERRRGSQMARDDFRKSQSGTHTQDDFDAAKPEPSFGKSKRQVKRPKANENISSKITLASLISEVIKNPEDKDKVLNTFVDKEIAKQDAKKAQKAQSDKDKAIKEAKKKDADKVVSTRPRTKLHSPTSSDTLRDASRSSIEGPEKRSERAAKIAAHREKRNKSGDTVGGRASGNAQKNLAKVVDAEGEKRTNPAHRGDGGYAKMMKRKDGIKRNAPSSQLPDPDTLQGNQRR